MLRSGNVIEMEESRIFCERFAEDDRLRPMLENPVLHDTEDVRVLCDLYDGLYSDDRLLVSYEDVAKFTLADRLLNGFALES